MAMGIGGGYKYLRRNGLAEKQKRIEAGLSREIDYSRDRSNRGSPVWFSLPAGLSGQPYR